MSSNLSEFESVQNTCAPFETTSSTFSEVESVVTLSSHNSPSADAPIENSKTILVHPEFAFPDGNIEIRASDQAFWVHEYRLNKFSVFETLIQVVKRSDLLPEPSRHIILSCEKKAKGVDIYNTLKVIYASHIDGIPDFDANTMISTLRIATIFDYLALRKFAILRLEGMDLPAIQRIQLSDELSLPAWETPAFAELCSRTEPISSTEAEVLGMTRFVEIARIREMGRTRWATEFVKGINENLNASPLVDLLQANCNGGDPGKDKLG